MSGFLKPKKFDPGAAQRLAEEAAAREAAAREKRTAEKAKRRALKEELGLSSGKANRVESDGAAADEVDGGSGHDKYPDGIEGSDYSAPSASDTSDSDNFDGAYGLGGSDADPDDDNDFTNFLATMNLKGEPMCPMRQYELLQRRYLRSVEEIKLFGDREREHEALMTDLKIMGKRQRALIMRTAEQNIDAKDQFISQMINRLKKLSSSKPKDGCDGDPVNGDGSSVDLASLLTSFENEFKDISLSMSRFNHNDASPALSASSLSTEEQDIDYVKVELSKFKAFNQSLEIENEALRTALTDLGYKDPERLVMVRHQLETAEIRLREVERNVEEAILEKEAAEEDASIARGAERAAKSRTQKLTSSTIGSTHDSDVTVTGDEPNHDETSNPFVSIVNSSDDPSSGVKVKPGSVPKPLQSSERKLVKDVRNLKSKVKKLEASKLALMSILRDAQAELAKRPKRPFAPSSEEKASSMSPPTTDIGHMAEQAMAVKKKDKKIQKLKLQVKELTAILRDLDEARKAEKLVVSQTTLEEGHVILPEQKRINVKTESLQKELDEALAAKTASDYHIAELKALAEKEHMEQKQLADSHEKLKRELESAVKAAADHVEQKSRLCDDLRRQLTKTKRDASEKENKLKTSIRSLTQRSFSLGAKVVKFGKYTRDTETGVRAELRRMQSSVTAELAGIPTIIAQAQEQFAEKLTKQLAAFSGLAEKYKREYRERKRLFNLVQELRGNIRVFCRVRPISLTEEKAGRNNVITFPADESDELFVDMGNGRKKRFEFDKVLKPGCTNSDVFAGVTDLCMSVLDGYNVCIFA